MEWIGKQGSEGQDLGGDAGLTQMPASEMPMEALTAIERDERPTLLVAAPKARAAELACWAARAGFRSLGVIEPHRLAERLAATIAVDVIVADLRDTCLDPENAHALAMRHGFPDTRIAVITDLAGLDRALSQLDTPGSEFLCDPDANDVVRSLVNAAITAEQQRTNPQLQDSGRENETCRIEQLSEEVRRLATMVERLALPGETNGHVKPSIETPSPFRMETIAGDHGAERMQARIDGATVNAVATTHGEIKSLLRARRMREQFLPADLFADPAWDMILDLMAARLAGQRVSVSSLCIAAAVPPTTALRWIRQLTDRGVFSRIDDPADGRRVFIELTDSAAEAVMAWSLAVRRTGGLLRPS
ncbi:MAG TPA: winged helix DNA-binding protein [Sphingobium sp.]